MIIYIKKFGEVLFSRESGREAYHAFLPTLNSLKSDEKIEIDFEGVSVLTPSWADEFLFPIIDKYRTRVSFKNDDNPSVKAALKSADNVDSSRFLEVLQMLENEGITTVKS